MERYSEYKDSGVKWLGQIPSHWEMQRWRFLMSENCCKNTDCHVRLQLQFKYGDIVQKSNQSEDSDVLETISKYTVVEPNDIMINGLNLNYDFVSQRVAQVREEGVITSAYVSLRPTQIANSRYYTYFLKSMDSKKMFHGMGTGIRLTLSYNELKNQFIPHPSLKEQEIIANYLDAATSKIDAAIAQQQKMIDLLNERKQIIINNSVTKGLDPNVKMKPSGVDWIGEIPEHWEVIRIKYLLKESKLRSTSGCEEPLSMSQIYGLIPTKDMDIIPNMASSFVGAKLVNKGELVFNKLKAHLGVFNVSKYNGLVSPDYAVYSSTGRANLSFLEYIFKTPKCIHEFVKLITGVGAGLSRLYTSDLYSIYCAIPPQKEQEEICSLIEEKTNKIKQSIYNCQNQISLLQERKQIIINDVVTGKVKVV